MKNTSVPKDVSWISLNLQTPWICLQAESSFSRDSQVAVIARYHARAAHVPRSPTRGFLMRTGKQ